MSVLSPPTAPPPKAPSIPAPKIPSSTSPNAACNRSPVPGAAAAGAVVFSVVEQIKEARKRLSCYQEASEKFFSNHPKGKPSKSKTRRQRICKNGGKPTKEYEDVDEVIGLLSLKEIRNGNQYSVACTDEYKDFMENQGFNKKEKGQVVKIRAERIDQTEALKLSKLSDLSRTGTLQIIGNSPMFPLRYCYFKMVRTRKKLKKCTCPDGSPCRKTRVE